MSSFGACPQAPDQGAALNSRASENKAVSQGALSPGTALHCTVIDRLVNTVLRMLLPGS